MAVQHHLDQPLMQINEIDISPGFETQVIKILFFRVSLSKLKYVSRSPCRPRCSPPPRRPRPDSLQKREAATLTERSCSNISPMACTGQDWGMTLYYVMITRMLQVWHRELSVWGGVWRGAGQVQLHPLLPLGRGGPAHHPQRETILQSKICR